MGEFLKSYRDIIVYHDYAPLLLFWNVSDLVNNRVLWMAYSEAVDGGQEWAYLQYALYFVVALGMLFSLPNVKSCARFVGAYLILYIFSTTRFVYLAVIGSDKLDGYDVEKSLAVTGVYFCLWAWIYTKMRVEIIHRKLNG